MGNLVSLMAHLPRGDEVIAGARPHTVLDEAGGHAVVVGASVRALAERPDGTLDPAAIVEAFRDPADLHEPITGLVALENTNAHPADGRSASSTRGVAAIAHERGVPLHVDGARFFNAAVALGVSAAELAAPGRQRDVLPVEGPRGAGRLGRRGHRAVHRSRAPCAQAPRRRHAPGRRARRGRARRARDGPDGDDHGDWPRTTPTPAGSPRASPASTASARPATSRSRRTARSIRPASSPTSCCSGSIATAPRSSPRSRPRRPDGGVPHGQVRAVTHHGISAADIEHSIHAVAGALADTAPQPAGDRAPSAA